MRIRYYLHGVVGILKALLGIDKAPKKLQSARLSICKKCPDNVNGSCYFCGCLVSLKARVLEEECDASRWPTEEEINTFEPDYTNLTVEQKIMIKRNIEDNLL